MVLSAPAYASECPNRRLRSDTKRDSDQSCLDIGRMGAIKIAVPTRYILGPDFVYKGVDIWNSKSFASGRDRSFDREIQYFSIRIRLSNFAPIESEADLKDFMDSMASKRIPSVSNQWIFANFRYPSYFEANKKSVDLNYMFKSYVDSEISKKPSFVKQSDRVDGFVHFLSPQKPSLSTSSGEINEVYYDEDLKNSIVTCSNTLRRVLPFDPIVSCHHFFFIPGGAIAVNVDNIRDKIYYVSHRKEIERGITNLFDCFIIK
jgi:hypothetical protein